MKLLGDRRNFDRLMTTRRHLVASPTVPNLMLHACLLVICNLCVHMPTDFFGIFFLDVMDSHDVVCIFLFICGGATCWLTRWLIGGDQRWRALFD